MHEVSDDEIAADIRRTAKRLGVAQLGRTKYLHHGKFSQHQIYDGGRNWDSPCIVAGIDSLKVNEVDYVVCWRNAWPEFPKPVLVLREYLRAVP